MSQAPIGIFDSGLGGFSIVAAVQNLLPNENIIYFGDTARVPYGNKSQETIIRYSREIVDFLLAHQVKTIVIACNTASSFALSTLQKSINVSIMGVIEPGISALLKIVTPTTIASVIGTRSTILSKAYDILLNQYNPSIILHTQACPLFVPLIEEAYDDDKVFKLVIQNYMNNLITKQVTHVLLGCTHYPLIKGRIQALYPQLQVIDPSVEVALSLKKSIYEQNSHNTNNTPGYLKIFVSDFTESLQGLEAEGLKVNLHPFYQQIKRITYIRPYIL